MSYNDNEQRLVEKNREAIKYLREAVENIIKAREIHKGKERATEKRNSEIIKEIRADLEEISKQSGIAHPFLDDPDAEIRKWDYQKRLDEREDWERFNFFTHPSMRPENRMMRSNPFDGEDCTTRYLDE